MTVRSADIDIVAPSGVRIAADEWPGDGPAVVLGPRRRPDPTLVGRDRRDARRHGHRVVSMDLRGHGDSDWAPDGDYHMAAFRDDALAVVRSIGSPVAWVGASLGGMTGLHAVDEAPELFSALVLVDITPRPAATGVSRILEFMAQGRRRRIRDPRRRRRRDRRSTSRIVHARTICRGCRRTCARAPTAAGVGTGIRRSSTSEPAGASEHARDRHHDELVDIARRLTLPTLLVRGKLSDLVTEAEVAEFLEMVPHARYVDVADAAHMIAGDRNDVFTDAVVDFLES